MFYERLSGNSLLCVAKLAGGVSFMLYGYDAGVLGGVQSTKPFLDAIQNPKGSYIIPMIASSYSLSATLSSVICMFTGMKMGRRNSILMGNAIVVIGGALQASSFSVAQIIVGRLLSGFGMGFISATVPMYISELSIEASQRGPAVGWQIVILISGIPLAYWIDLGFTQMTNQVSWRFPIALQSGFAFTSATLFSVLPDTPRWYYANSREREGDLILSKLHEKPIDDARVQAMRCEILENIKFEREAGHSFRIMDLIWDKSDLRVGRRLRTGFILYMLDNLMGINMMVYFSTTIFANIGLSSFLSHVLAAVMNTLFAIGCVAMPLTVERFGRRNLMLWGGMGCTICMLLFVLLICLPEHLINNKTRWSAVAMVVCFNFFFGWGWVGVPWLYPSEISPLQQRHIGGAMAALGEWLFAFVTIFAGGIALDRVGPMIWIWNLLSCALAVVYVYFCCPETTGLSLEEVDILYAKSEVKERLLTMRENGNNSSVEEKSSVLQHIKATGAAA
ncbi:putative sugar transporter STL1 [Talaromyces proteolyticus]|uniref:Sugar transporter STL1 n=1 Tax=Talaromyces proteolyticus TaxID=1131652 RepID=A0AAD4KJP6_9EURO|nr:putative sugar transporter STL1 [Talaromyces proteolyticus]KAH8691883.1 putative sugar transporter STL1 [Talaromyces proteolyticus]